MFSQSPGAVVSSLLVLALLPGVASASWPDDEPELPWVSDVESQGVVFFAYQTPPSIERYSLTLRSWLDTIPLDEAPTAITADADGLYVSFGRRTSRFTRLGADETHLRNSNNNVTELFTVGEILFIYDEVDMMSVGKSDGTVIDNSEQYPFWYSMAGLSVAPNLGYVFGRSTGVSPSDILRVTFSADGTIGDLEDSPYHGDYPWAKRCFVFPDESSVADDSGTVYDTRSLRYAGSFGGRFSDLTFAGGFAYIVRDGTIISYTDRMLRTADYTPENMPLKIVVSGEDIISFHQGQEDVEAEALPLSLLEPREPGGAVSPGDLAYEPGAVELLEDGSVLLLSSVNRNVFRWSVAENMYLPSIPLLGGAGLMAFSEITETLYLGYGNGEITQIPFGEEEVGVESAFVNTAYPTTWLSAANEYLFVVYPSPYLDSYLTTFHPDGTLLSQIEEYSVPEEFVWNEATRRMFFIDDWPAVAWKGIYEDGVIGGSMTSIYGNDDGIINPPRVRSDGGMVVLGSGRLFDGNTLEQLDTLSNNIADAVWIDDQLFTLRSFGSGSQLQKWGANYGVDAAREIDGEPIRLFQYEYELLTVTLRDGKPYFMVWDESLNAVGIPVSMTDGRTTAVAADTVEYTITVSNESASRRAGINVQSLLSAQLGNARWSCVPSLGSSCTAGPTAGEISDIVEIAPEGEVVFTLVAQVSTDASGELLSRVDVWQTGGRTVYRSEDTTVVATRNLRRGNASGRRTP